MISFGKNVDYQFNEIVLKRFDVFSGLIQIYVRLIIHPVSVLNFVTVEVDDKTKSHDYEGVDDERRGDGKFFAQVANLEVAERGKTQEHQHVEAHDSSPELVSDYALN